MTNVEVFKPKAAYGFAAAVFVFVALWVAQSVFYSDGSTIGLDLSVAAATTATAWLFLVRPKLELSDEGVRVVNPLRTFTIGWQDIREIDTRFALTFKLDGRNVRVWVAPANGRRRMNRMNIYSKTGSLSGVSASDLKGVKTASFDGNTIIASDSPASDSGLAAHLARTRISEFRATGTAIDYSSRINWIGSSILTAAVVCGVLFASVH
jgi:hypothetical protein